MPPFAEADSVPTRIQTVLVTAPDAETAERLGRTVVEERLAACANLLPGVVSLFRWEGQMQREAEVLVILKTTRERLDALRARIVELHPYDVPEILALGVESGHDPYLEWVRAEASGT